MNFMKKLISLILTAMLVFGAASAGLIAANAGDGIDRGEIIVFGSYPKTDVTDELGDDLSMLSDTEGEWKSFGCYSGTGSPDDAAVSSDYMKYKDLTFEGKKYRGVTFSKYRPGFTYREPTDKYSFQDDNGYEIGNVYWFRYDPISWRLLDPSTGLLMCDFVIDSQPYTNIIKASTEEPGEYYNSGDKYANDWESSYIRAWLNDDFYNTAFTDEEKAIITESKGLDNTSPHKNDYDSPETDDNIFLLSYNEALNEIYGFDKDKEAFDEALHLQAGDYAVCRGLYLENHETSEFYGNTVWFLRSPGSSSRSVCAVLFDGSLTEMEVPYAAAGVVPAMKINLEALAWTVTFDANGGAGAPAPIKGKGKMPLPADIPTKEGYKFIGWTDDPEYAEGYYKEGAEFFILSDTILFALWEAAENSATSTDPGKPATTTDPGKPSTSTDPGKPATSTDPGSSSAVAKAVITAPEGTKTINWKFKAQMKAEAKDMPSGYHVAWFEGDKNVCDKDEFTTESLTDNHTYTAKIADSAGKAVSAASQEKSVTIEVKSDFFTKIISFFMRLFGSATVVIS